MLQWNEWILFGVDHRVSFRLVPLTFSKCEILTKISRTFLGFRQILSLSLKTQMGHSTVKVQ